MHYKRYALGLLLLCWLGLGLSSAVYAGEPVVKLTNPNGQVFQLEAKIESSDLQAELQKPSGYLRHLDHIFIFLAAAAIIFLSLRYQLLNSKRRKPPITLWDGLAWLLLLVATLLVANAIAELWFSDISTQEGVLEKVGENAGLKNLQDFYLAPITVILGFLAILFVIQIEANRLKNERKHAQLKSQENLRDAAEYATELLKEYDRHQLDFIHDPIPVKVDDLDDKNRFLNAALAISKYYDHKTSLHSFVTYYPNYLVVDEDDQSGYYSAYYAHYLLFLYCLGDGSESKIDTVVKRSLHSHYLSHVRQLLEPDHNDLAHELQKVQTVIEDLFLRGDFNLNSDENAANRSTMRHFLTFQRISQELSEIRRARVYIRNIYHAGEYNNSNDKLVKGGSENLKKIKIDTQNNKEDNEQPKEPPAPRKDKAYCEELRRKTLTKESKLYEIVGFVHDNNRRDLFKDKISYFKNKKIIDWLVDGNISSIEAAEIVILLALVREMHMDSFLEALLRVKVELENEHLRQRFYNNTSIQTEELNCHLQSIENAQLDFNMIFRFTRGVFNRYRYYDLFHTLHHLRVQADKAVKLYERSLLDQLLVGKGELGKVIESFELTQATYKKLVAFEEVHYHNSSYLCYQPLIRILLTRETIVLDEGSEPPPGLLYRNDNDEHVKILVSHVKEFIENNPSEYSYFLFDLLYWIKEVYLDQELFNRLKDNYKIMKENHPETYKLFEERIKSVFGTQGVKR